MAHRAQQIFIEEIKSKYPDSFSGKKVIDFGSLDINGSNKIYFDNCEYIGVDIAEGKNVDVVSKCHEFTADRQYDAVITTEMLEHDMYWDKSLENMLSLLKSGGLLLITCATTGRREHGTPKSDKGYSSPFTSDIPEWANYYKNLTHKDVSGVLNPEENFEVFGHRVEKKHKDYYFYGIKK